MFSSWERLSGRGKRTDDAGEDFRQQERLREPTSSPKDAEFKNQLATIVRCGGRTHPPFVKNFVFSAFSFLLFVARIGDLLLPHLADLLW